MPDLNFTRSVRPPALVRQGGVPGHARTLQNANREAMHMLGMPMDTPGDPKGRVLRECRLQQGIDPSLLATQACMSLSQLYELENGGHSRFYSDSLRRQAARRVARLLGLDWDQIEVGEPSQSPSTSNVVSLQRTLATGSALHVASVMTPAVSPVEAPVSAGGDLSVEAPAVVTAANADANAEADAHAVSMGLATPACETLLVQPPGGEFAATVKASSAPTKSSGWSTLFALLLVVMAGAAAGYAFAEYSPYRLYWPW